MIARAAAVALIIALAWPVAASAADVTGLWRTQTDAGVVQIDTCGDTLCGHLMGSTEIDADPGLLDTRNSDPQQRSRPLKGLLLLWGLTGSDSVWTGGTIYNPEDGHRYASRLNLIDADHLDVKGCFGPFCRTQHWTRMR